MLNIGGNNTWQGPVNLDSVPASFPSPAAQPVAFGVNNRPTALTIDGTIGQTGGSFGLTKVGPARSSSRATANNTYTGVTTVQTGVLNIQKNQALGTAGGPPNNGTVVNAGAALESKPPRTASPSPARPHAQRPRRRSRPTSAGASATSPTTTPGTARSSSTPPCPTARRPTRSSTSAPMPTRSSPSPASSGSASVVPARTSPPSCTRSATAPWSCPPPTPTAAAPSSIDGVLNIRNTTRSADAGGTPAATPSSTPAAR